MKFGFETDAGNQIMLTRLKKIAKKEIKATEIDINFAKQSFERLSLLKRGLTQEEAHTLKLKEQGMYHPGYEKNIYSRST